jgi:uncharacterized small protein (DUF1192 family)
MQPDDDRPVRKVAHQIGQDLSTLAVDELGERIALLKAEIERLEAAIATKSATRAAADQLFRFS